MTARRATLALLLCTFLFTHAFDPKVWARAPHAPAQQTTPATAAAPRTSAALNADIERIKEEGMKRSQVMATIRHLTETIGPRLTGSPAARRANEWTRDRLAGWGLSNAHLEAWGPFGRGWTLERFSAEVVEPQAFPLLAYPKAWSPATNGPLTGEVVNVEASTDAELQKYKGKLKGSFVLVGALRQPLPEFTQPRARRYTNEQLAQFENAPVPAATASAPSSITTAEQRAAREAAQAFAIRKLRFFHDEGAALLIDSSRGGDGGMLQFIHSAAVPQPSDAPGARRFFSWERDAPKTVPQIGVSNDNYNRLVRMIEAGERVRATVNIRATFHDSDPMGYNTIAEIPGTDLKDEVVMLGAHLDSWHTATGATDNAAGVGMMMEAVRIIRALDLKPRRTIRIGLWTGEEEGLFGSEGYVKEHFGPVGNTAEGTTPKYKPAYEKLSVYFNSDSGTGRVRGIYAQGNAAARDIFRRWLEPFKDLGATTATLANSSGSDFLAFEAVGLPGFDFLQDDVEYETRTWHSNQDTFDRIVEADVKQGATVIAGFVYNAAMMDERLPRKPARR